MTKLDAIKIMGEIKKHANHNGMMLTSVISIEECSELQKELTKFLRTDADGDKTHLIEEMVDVYICILMLRFTYGISAEEFEAMFDKKMERIRRKEGFNC